MFFSGVITSNHSVYKALSVTFAKQSIPSSIPCNRCKALCHCWLSPTHVIPVVQQTASRRSSSRRIMRSEQMWWTDMLKAYEKHYEELWSCWTFLCFVLLPQCLLSSKFFEVLRSSSKVDSNCFVLLHHGLQQRQCLCPRKEAKNATATHHIPGLICLRYSFFEKNILRISHSDT